MQITAIAIDFQCFQTLFRLAVQCVDPLVPEPIPFRKGLGIGHSRGFVAFPI